jgi:hypothetical protein
VGQLAFFAGGGDIFRDSDLVDIFNVLTGDWEPAQKLSEP